MMLSQYQQALEDARASVSLDSAFVKGWVHQSSSLNLILVKFDPICN